ncbi:alpha/beta fold hydrolase [Thauera sp. CAU 1555]|uniref:Alpha/beta fold hydrolase n=1 Tax=Thauera sedimentorum TaxID=2767595 RepID=A0ABR9BFF8_9RHOO|nr:alpha/beta fold hydrolase [Thauera sedimentorum]MBC9073775.1 alpha/beta fold hydrolase [Thauera sedimentorum]MBD8504694.1 alpha/beta fold hydrolase [Thauera sedimentorum]
MSPFQSPAWLPGGHAQTIWPLARKGTLPPLRRERWNTPDGDFIDLDWLARSTDAARPLVVLFHGLEGSSGSHYARALLRALAVRGWRGVVPHFRGCSGEANRLARAYHSGDSTEIDWILRRLAPLAGGAPLFAAGVSLGGNALLKWLGEREHEAGTLLAGAAAICPPLDLTISGHALGRGFNRLYSAHFLLTLRAKALAKHARDPGLFDATRVRRARSLYEFDDAYTGPVHGFAGADDYWRRASSKPWLRAIRVPTLLLNAANDPFVPRAALPRPAELAAAVRFECPPHGGHVGFLGGAFPGHIGWLPERLLQHFDTLSR